ncbi:MAG: ECF-type sigma factor, partial [Bacteroidota bacterium]
LHDDDVKQEHSFENIIALDDALKQLEAVNERACRIVECRFFGGLTVDETAEALGISPATVARDWRMARAWLKREFRR